jgi:predicted DNA-binding protein
MEVHVTPETAKRLKDLATTSGHTPEDIVEDALAGYLEEVASVRPTLDSRYDDLKSGRVKPPRGSGGFHLSNIYIRLRPVLAVRVAHERRDEAISLRFDRFQVVQELLASVT